MTEQEGWRGIEGACLSTQLAFICTPSPSPPSPLLFFSSPVSEITLDTDTLQDAQLGANGKRRERLTSSRKRLVFPLNQIAKEV